MPEPQSATRLVLDQINALPHSNRALVICDVDEVILHLVSHLESYLKANDLVFLKHTYKFTGNIGHKEELTPLPGEEVRRHLIRFFDEESHRQQMVDGADTGLARIAETHEVILLTNLPGAHNKPIREKLLARMNIPYPVLTNSGPKGGAVAALSKGRPNPVIFIDDSPANHASVNASLPSASLVQFIADDRFRGSMEPAPHIDLLTGNWSETADFIAASIKDI
ncbi:hypothetical protein [Roseibium algae]|uniref:Hydrolase of the HAD superfamily n=1 Tax=Roseibium algae TaxID=3123038 RepID=A0ABU8TQP1_9HYPH